ncbi:MAG: corrinoid protein [Ardenticatenaceae bacterium]|nr:corrinoid protein [Ardenticatenaceae bacterium]
MFLFEGNARRTTEQVCQALAAGCDPAAILDEALIAAMEEVGRCFEKQECFVPEMLAAARAMKAALGILKPYLLTADVEPVGKVVLGTVKGDVHDIGKNLVAMMFEGAGFAVIDLGVDVSPEQFVDAVQEHQPTFVGLSALLTTTVRNMRLVVKALKEAGVRDQVTLMVGGAPVTQQFADEIGADIFAADAPAAAAWAKAALAVV